MEGRTRFRGAAYLVPVAAVALALPLTWWITPLEQTPSTLFLAAVMLSAYCGGLGPGLLATVLSGLALDWFFMPPAYSLQTGIADAVRLGVFVLVAVMISSLSAARRRLAARLQQEHRHKDHFLAVLAHELRNPLAAIRTALAVLGQAGAGRETAEKARGIIERQTGTMARLVDDLLDVSRIGCGKIQLQKRRLDLHEAVEHAIERVQPLAVARRQRLEVSVPKGPLWLEADPTRLEQVLVNLLTNACKYTPESGRVWLSAESGGDEVCVRVRDNGAGLDAALLPRVFDLFVQAQDGSQGGLGIGLNLVRGLVRLHGGTVTAHSEGPGKGSEFVVRLPASTGLPPGDEGNGGPIALPDSGCSPESVPAAHTKDSAVPAAIASGDGA